MKTSTVNWLFKSEPFCILCLAITIE